MYTRHSLPGWKLIHLLEFKNNPLQFLSKIRELGDIVLVGKQAGSKIYVLNHPDLIKEVLVQKPSSFRKGRGLQIAGKFLGQGLLTSEGDTHMRLRRLMQPQFHMKHINTFADLMAGHTERMIDSWGDQQERDIHNDMTELALDIINETMFGHTVTEDVERIGKIIEDNSRMNMALAKRTIRLPRFLSAGKQARMQESRAYLDQIIYSMIQNRRSHPEAGHADLLSMLLDARDEDGSQMTDKEIRDQLITVYIAGHETTANTLSWTWYLLARYEEAEQKFWAELDEMLGGRLPTFSDVPKLKYTQRIIQESMRLYPAAWMIGRQAVGPVEIGGESIAEGDTLFMSQYSMHRSRTYYKDPDQFRPERFEHDFVKTLPAYAYFPFGGGPRVCIGNNFALMEAAMILAVVGQKYKLRLVSSEPVEPEPLITLRIKGGLRMKVQKREGGSDNEIGTGQKQGIVE